jgi:HSP20 family protein
MLLRWEPADVQRFRQDMNRVWSWFRDDWDSDFSRPRTRLHELENEFVVEVELPGVDPDTVDLEVDADNVLVKGPLPKSPAAPDEDRGNFQAAVSFPGEVDPDRAQATFRHGLLVVRIPKAHATRRKIAVKAQS